MPQESGFNTFESDYDKVNRIDTPTWTKRKVYDDRPYLVLPNFKFNMKLGDTKPVFKCFVKKAGEQFGDAISLPNLADYNVKLKVYDYNNELQFQGVMVVSNAELGEVSYVFSPLDFSKSGIYFCEIELTNNNSSFTLPDTHAKYENYSKRLMYGYTRQWGDGNHKWLQKTKKQDGAGGLVPTDNILMATLSACDVKTDIQFTTWKVERGGVILKHFDIIDTVSWEIDNNMMIVHSEDEAPFTLVFISASEAQKADYRLFMIVNGAMIVDCDDHVYYRCTKPSNARLTFV